MREARWAILALALFGCATRPIPIAPVAADVPQTLLSVAVVPNANTLIPGVPPRIPVLDLPIPEHPSIRSALLVRLLLGLVVVAALATLATYIETRREIGELFDLQLKQLAKILGGLDEATVAIALEELMHEYDDRSSGFEIRELLRSL